MNTVAIQSPVGWWTVASLDERIAAVDFHGAFCPSGIKTEPQTRLEQQAHCMLSRYFRGEVVEFERLPVRFPDQPVRVGQVMTILRSIPHGTLHTYSWVAEQMGIPKAPRAAGGALGRNPIPIIVPCHRVIAANGLLGGFMRGHAEGWRVKSFLLELEGHHFHERRLLASINPHPEPLMQPV